MACLFGEAFQDQLPLINSYTHNGIIFTNEIRDFLKERASLDRDYAHRLEQLAKRFQKQKEKLGLSLMGEPSQLHSLGSQTPDAATSQLSQDKYGSTFQAWDQLLTQTEEIAKERQQFAEQVLLRVGDPLKALALRKDEARKKHLAFAQKLADERNRAIGDKDKSKEKYEHACDLVEAAKAKQEKTPDEKLQEKFKKQYQLEIMEMHNVKNNYILSVHVANALQKKYLFSDMPALLDQLQVSNEDRTETIKTLLDTYVHLDKETVERLLGHYDTMLSAVGSIQPQADSQLFVQYHRASGPWQAPPEFVFEPSLLWKDTDTLEMDEQARIYLANKLAKSKDRLQELQAELQTKQKEIDGLTNLKNAYTKNPATGNPDEVQENILEARRAVMLLETAKTRYETWLSVLGPAVGDFTDGKRHNLQKASFTIPTTCDYCQEKIWGLAKQGFTCKECGYNCHAKCEMKVPPYCALSKDFRLKRAGSTGSAFATTPSSSASPSRNNLAGSQTLKGTSSIPEIGTTTMLYAYEAANADELTVSEGDAVRLVKEDDGNGWMTVELVKTGKQGLVPASYVASLSAMQPSATSRTSSPALYNSSPLSGMHAAKKSSQVRVVFDYAAQNPDELSISAGDVLEVLHEGTDGWSEGRDRLGKVGQFPTSYAEAI